jgi:HAD superfamily hydrolase (TIGR01509 family)
MNLTLQMPERLPLSALIFDLDGLVLDTESTYILAWQHAALVMGYALSEAFCLSLSGLHHQAVEAKLLAACGNNFDLHTFNHEAGKYWRDYVRHYGIPVKPGVLELLDYLNECDLPFALATNSRSENVKECLKFAGLQGVFRLQSTRDNVALGKPAPDVFLHAAKMLQKPIGQCWVLEDSLTGIVAAHQAGAFSVYIPSVAPANSEAANLCDLLLPNLHSVLAIIRAEFAQQEANQV